MRRSSTQGSRSGLNAITDTRFLTVACTDPQRFLIPNDRDGDGYLAVDGGVKALGDPAFDGDPFVDFLVTLLADADLEPGEEALAAAGAGQFAWAYVEALRIAAELDGGVSRTNLLLALRSLQLRHPMVLSGITFGTDGGADAYPMEGSTHDALLGRSTNLGKGVARHRPERCHPQLFSWNGTGLLLSRTNRF